MLNNCLIILPINPSLTDGCDYTLQTIRILARDNEVFTILLGEPLKWSDLFSIIWGKKQLWFSKWNATFIHPFYLFPGTRFFIIKQINLFLNALILRVYLSLKIPKQKFLWIFEPYNTKPFFNVFKNYYSIYDCVDNFSEISSEHQQTEQLLLKQATTVVVNSSILKQLHQTVRPNLTQVPLGFAKTLYSKDPFSLKTKGFSSPIVLGYIGSLDYRLDYNLLIKLLTNNSDTKLILLGPKVPYHPDYPDPRKGQQINHLLELSQVEWLGNKPKAMLPKLMDTIDIGLIPYDLSIPFSRYSYPMKLFEYFYLGKPVLATELPALESLAELIFIGNTAKEFQSQINRLKQNGWPKSKQLIQRQLALANSWQNKIEVISKLVESKGYAF